MFDPVQIALGIVCVALLFALLVQRRINFTYLERARRARAEKDAVIRLMDNIGERMTRGVDPAETLDAIVRYIVEATRAESGALYLLDGADDRLAARTIVGVFPPLFEDGDDSGRGRAHYVAERIRKRRIAPGEGIVGIALEADRPLLITDAEADPRVPAHVSALAPVHSLLLAPLRVRGRNFGVLILANKQGDAVFDSADALLLQALADQAAVTVDLVKLYDMQARQQRIEQELLVARDFQNMLLPAACPTVDGFEFAALSRPALSVGGDFYDFIPLVEGRLGIVVADVSGKGIPAALVMATVRAHLRAEARQCESPREALRRVNDSIRGETRKGVFVTIVYGVLDPAAREFRFVRAGHEPVLVRRAGPEPRVEEIAPEGMAVGLFPDAVFAKTEEEILRLEPGDALVVYTDGVVEANDGAGAEYGRERLLRRLLERGGGGATELLADLRTDIDDHAKGLPQHDDITMVTVRAKPAVG